MRFSRHPIATVMPEVARVRGNETITASTAILFCIRNEMPDRVMRNLEPMLAGLDASGFGGCFRLYVLSDTNDPGIADIEEARFVALTKQWRESCAGDLSPALRQHRI